MSLFYFILASFIWWLPMFLYEYFSKKQCEKRFRGEKVKSRYCKYWDCPRYRICEYSNFNRKETPQ